MNGWIEVIAKFYDDGSDESYVEISPWPEIPGACIQIVSVDMVDDEPIRSDPIIIHRNSAQKLCDAIKLAAEWK